MCDNPNCESDRLIQIQGHCVDRFNGYYKRNREYGPDYVPGGIGLGMELGRTGDDIELTFCAECGKIQGVFPISESVLNEVFVEKKYDDEDEE